jgi:hypothetical protein
VDVFDTITMTMSALSTGLSVRRSMLFAVSIGSIAILAGGYNGNALATVDFLNFNCGGDYLFDFPVLTLQHILNLFVLFFSHSRLLMSSWLLPEEQLLSDVSCR